MAKRDTVENEQAATDAGTDVVDAIRDWVATYAQPAIPAGAVSAGEFAKQIGKSIEQTQSILRGLVRCGKWDRAKGKDNRMYQYWPIQPVGKEATE